MDMVSMHREVLRVLLDRLMEKELLTKSIYDGAVNLVNSRLDFPDIFRHPVCCPKEGNDNGSSQDTK